jgi:hypothetical protein
VRRTDTVDCEAEEDSVDVDGNGRVDGRGQEGIQLVAKLECMSGSDLVWVGGGCMCGSALLDALLDKDVMLCLGAVVGSANGGGDLLFTRGPGCAFVSCGGGLVASWVGSGGPLAMKDAFVNAFCDVGDWFDCANIMGHVGRDVVVDKVGDASIDDSLSGTGDGGWKDVDGDEVQFGQVFKLGKVDACKTVEADVVDCICDSDTIIFVLSGAVAMREVKLIGRGRRIVVDSSDFSSITDCNSDGEVGVDDHRDEGEDCGSLERHGECFS